MSGSRSRTTTATGKSSARRGAVPPFDPASAEWSNPDTASTATPAPKGSDAPPATDVSTEIPTDSNIDGLLRPIKQRTPTRDERGSAITVSESAGTSQTSPNSDVPSRTSNRHWRIPRNAKEWAAQLNSIATGVMNGEIDLEHAKVVSSISRSAAQLLTAEVQRARFLQIEPDLNLLFPDTPEISPSSPDSPHESR